MLYRGWVRYNQEEAGLDCLEDPCKLEDYIKALEAVVEEAEVLVNSPIAFYEDSDRPFRCPEFAALLGALCKREAIDLHKRK